MNVNVYFMIDRQQLPNDHWLEVLPVVIDQESTEVAVSSEVKTLLCTSAELQETMDAAEFLVKGFYARMPRRAERTRTC